MNAYKIISVTPEILTVEWTILGKARTERLDARYLPMTNSRVTTMVEDENGKSTEVLVEEQSYLLNKELQRLLDAMAKDATPVEIPADVQAMVGQKTALEVKEVILAE